MRKTETLRVIVPRWRSCLLLCVGLGMASTLPAADAVQSTWFGRFALAPGGRVAAENIHGNLTVEGWDRAEVEAIVTKTALEPTGRLADVRVNVEFGTQSLTFRTLYPDDLDDLVRVDYRLRVPRQVRLDGLRTLQGNITVRDVEGSVDARSLSGSIFAEGVSGSVIAHALTGNVVASLRSLSESEAPVVLDTLNGDVDLSLPPHPNADLDVNTVAGGVKSNYVFVTSAALGDTTRRTRLGNGGTRVSLRTVRGDVRVGQRSDVL
jgi:hypothetical protein